ncbi:MAG: glycosyltransferase [Bradyrhizobium sp.]|nr:glycosyltransferase [Bradyrhizobium sp.]
MAAAGSEPLIDVRAVICNSARWVEEFVGSLIAQRYPAGRVNLVMVDHGSTDGTLDELEALRRAHGAAFAGFVVKSRENRGLGAGQGAAAAEGNAPFILVSNVDLTFETDALERVVAMALADAPDIAAWELRQKPYEHPKFYDPVTLETAWNSYACVLLRRTAFEAVGGYDEAHFVHGADVELSYYRLRCSGWRLHYCPPAVVWHCAYQAAEQIEPLRYTDCFFANLYIRLVYGEPRDMAAIPIMALGAVLRRQAYRGARREILLASARLACAARRGVAPAPFVRCQFWLPCLGL